MGSARACLTRTSGAAGGGWMVAGSLQAEQPSRLWARTWHTHTHAHRRDFCSEWHIRLQRPGPGRPGRDSPAAGGRGDRPVPSWQAACLAALLEIDEADVCVREGGRGADVRAGGRRWEVTGRKGEGGGGVKKDIIYNIIHKRLFVLYLCSICISTIQCDSR